MRNTWTSIAGLGACSLLGVLLLSDASWAAPNKGTYWACKCTCVYQDELGKTHEGQPGGAQFTESSLARCLGHTCKSGTYSGTTRNCTATEKTPITRIPSGNLPTLQQQTPTMPGGVRAPTTRGVEGEKAAEPPATAPTGK